MPGGARPVRPPNFLGKDYYGELGLKPGATPKEIRSAYYALINAVHPDKCPPQEQEAAKKRAQRLNEAYEVLYKKSEWKAAYASHLRKKEQEQQKADEAKAKWDEAVKKRQAKQEKRKREQARRQAEERKRKREQRRDEEFYYQQQQREQQRRDEEFHYQQQQARRSSKTAKEPRPEPAFDPFRDPGDLKAERKRRAEAYQQARRHVRRGIPFGAFAAGCGCLGLVLVGFIISSILPRNETIKQQLMMMTAGELERALVRVRHRQIAEYLKGANVLDPTKMNSEQFAVFMAQLFGHWRKTEWDSGKKDRCAHLGEYWFNEEHYLAWTLALNQAVFGTGGTYWRKHRTLVIGLVNQEIGALERQLDSRPEWQLKVLREDTLPLLKRVAASLEEFAFEEKEALYQRHEIDVRRIRATFARYRADQGK